MADINITITVVFGILSTIMVFVGILMSRSAKKISEAQKRIGMITIMQPLTKNPRVYELFLDYMSKWFDDEDRAKIGEAMERMNIKTNIVSGRVEVSGEDVHAATKSDEEEVLQQILNVMEEINKKLLPKEEGVKKMSIVRVNVCEGFGQENTKTVIQNIKNVFEDLDIPAEAVKVIVHEIPKS